MKCYHVFQTGRPRETFFCEREASNPHSGAATVVTIDDRIIGHVSDHLVVILVPLLNSG